MADKFAPDILVFLIQFGLAIYFYHRGSVLGLVLLSPTAFYWIDDENIPLSFRFVCGIAGGIGLLIIILAIPRIAWTSWKMRFRRRAVKSFQEGDFQRALEWISLDKKKYRPSRDHYSLHAQILNGMKQYADALLVLDQAYAEGFYGTNLIWDRIWALCRLNRHSEALTYLEERLPDCAEIELEYVGLLIFYARVYIDLKQVGNAKEVFQQVEAWMKVYRNDIPMEFKGDLLQVYEECKNLYNALLRGNPSSNADRFAEAGE